MQRKMLSFFFTTHKSTFLFMFVMKKNAQPLLIYNSFIQCFYYFLLISNYSIFALFFVVVIDAWFIHFLVDIHIKESWADDLIKMFLKQCLLGDSNFVILKIKEKKFYQLKKKLLANFTSFILKLSYVNFSTKNP